MHFITSFDDEKRSLFNDPDSKVVSSLADE